MKKLVLLWALTISSTLYAVEHFAFFGDAMNGVGSGNFIQKTKEVSTLHFITASYENESIEWRNKVSEAANGGNKSVLMLESLFFQWASVRPNANQHNQLEQLKQKLTGLEDSIAVIYLIDEPYFKNSLASAPLSIEQVHANLEEAALIAKSYFPKAKIAMTEAYPSFKTNFKIPASIDWIGVNCYLFFGKACSLDKLAEFNLALSKKMLPHQRFIFTLDAYWGNSDAGKPAVQKSIIARNNEIMKLAQKHNAVAFVPFLYQSHISSTETLHGANEMEQVLNYLTSIGKRVKNKTFSYSNVCEVQEAKCEGKDYVRRNSCGNEIERWKNAPSPYCLGPGEVLPAKPGCTVLEPKCEGVDYIRRDSCGNMMERWANAPAPYCPVK